MIYRGTPGEHFRPIGTVWVPSGSGRNDFDHPAYYETIAYGGQTVVVWSNGYYVKWTVKGYVVNSWFGGSKETPAGTNREHTITAYAFSWAAGINSGEYVNNGVLFDLLPEYGTGCAPYVSDPDKIGHFITMPDSGHPLLVTKRPCKNTDMQVHTYRVTWRGERRANVMVKRNEGFNGDTHGVAIRRAAEALDLVAMAI